VSPNKGRRPTSGKGGKKGASAKRAKDPAALRRLAVLVFAALFIVLFVIVAVAEGIGDPNIPDGDVAVIEDAPSGEGNISEKEFDRALKQSAAQSGKKEIPKPGDPQYDELKEAALGSLLDAAWLKGEAAEKGITASKAEVAKEFKKLKKENFKTEVEYEKFLKESEFTQADVDSRVELQMLSTEIQKQITEGVGEPSKSDIENYYDAALATQFTQPATVDIRLVVNKDKNKAESALADLKADNSAKNWKILRRRTEQIQRRLPERHRRRRPRRTSEQGSVQHSREPGRRARQDRTRLQHLQRRKLDTGNDPGSRSGRIPDQVPARTAG
jgi:hypothetical protein